MQISSLDWCGATGGHDHATKIALDALILYCIQKQI